ncbi:MAG: DivIVA domain-containing protein [Actinobacteria bacterium]|nr:DivIVA domain-containing protein [Cyanobacteriota bacterium]MCL6088153.1 DivIVA domain-containing protein [Actinomycetota bacterium]
MNINSEYIQKKEFHTAFKGYNMEEVDKFLDVLSVEFERIIKKNKELQENLDKVKYEGGSPDQETDLNKLVSEVLVSAHKVADEIRKKAEIEAQEIVQSKRKIEEDDMKNLLKEKKELEEKVKYLSSFYDNFISKIKDIVKDFNLKINSIENEFVDESIVENLKSNVISIDAEKNLPGNLQSSPFVQEKTEETDEMQKNIDVKQPEYEKQESKIYPEIKKLSDDAEEQKIKEIIESRDFEEEKNNLEKEIKKDKRIFDNYEEEKITRERKKSDIANPDIINEFFGNNDERKY